MRKLQLYIHPLQNKVIFPYQYISMRMVENQYDCKAFLLAKQYNNLVGIITKIDVKDSSINSQL